MAPAQDPSTQVQFLVTCIKHCTAPGRVDFAAVAAELSIPSKAAAAKRYERLLKAHNAWPTGGLAASAGGDGPASTPATPKGKAKEGAAATPRSRKRKNAADDDTEGKSTTKTARKKAGTGAKQGIPVTGDDLDDVLGGDALAGILDDDYDEEEKLVV
ncbi:hypothetical protein GGTG_11260 [Gaeumannomyces tritici R3-111a-1]|uniref:Myb-like DNA-binding domain-containing protein n=1 Tax=Gaeumannomyces tritici (strain R3-111a-1) TaxID=644352 RepID=J3PCP2_GAET3|nr:hypothetical protein GGTG_11260 [Gaeumannomyces tritici R3-111a-1]EJT72012.1 hypothetical protein GGTG_11260 [Gaeumannomyces tritici R3-111a-1]